MYRFSIVVAALFFVIGCQQEMPSPAEAMTEDEIAQIEKDVLAVFTSLMDAAKVDDMEKQLTLFSTRKDGYYLSDTLMLSMPQIKEMIEGTIEEGTKVHERQEFEGLEMKAVVLSPTIALVMSKVPEATAYYVDGGQKRFAAASSQVFIKENQEWKVHSLHQSIYPKEETGLEGN